ncbi:MAG: CehA/McbA family metallohydrolase [Planctomycetota bacterium]|jgi:hypothetical protein
MEQKNLDNNKCRQKLSWKCSTNVTFLSVVILVATLSASRTFAGQLINPFLQEGNWYKSSLHVHTTTSDGDVNVSVRLEQYRSRGFDVVAITDHWKTNDIDGLSNEKFLVINGMEVHPKSNSESNNHFLCLNLPKAFKIRKDEDAQKVINMVKAAGGEVIYAHPYWTGHTIEDLQAVNGYIGIEVYNGTCQLSIAKGYNHVHWDGLLNKGFVVPAIATDDIHNSKNIELGWTMIKANKLTTDEIMNALRTGSYYASCGPTIKDFKVENGVVRIKCSPVSTIYFYGQINLGYKVDGKDGQPVTQAEWELPKKCRFVRAELIDANGKHAWTNPIVLKSYDHPNRP